mgnify:CR=1 FL=1
MKTQTSSLEIPHFPVMLSEIIKIASPSKGGLYIDCTFGGGGYTKAFLKFSFFMYFDMWLYTFVKLLKFIISGTIFTMFEKS